MKVGHPMLTYKSVYETSTSSEYEYRPEGNKNVPGLVSTSKKDGAVSIVKLSPSDDARIYALKLFKKLRQFHFDGKYPKQGAVSYY